MRALKKLFVSLFIAGSFLGAAPARAGIPVIDVASLVQAILETLAWIQQAEDMIQTVQNGREQIEGIGRTVESLANARNLGTILNDPNIAGLLPSEMQNANQLLMSAVHSPSRLQAIEGVLGAYGIQPASNGAQLNGVRGAADSLAKMQQLLQSTQARAQQVSALARRVDTAADAKDSMDLVARNVIESTRVNNDMMAAMATIEADKQVAQLRLTQESQQRLASFRARAADSATALGH